ncbi:MAG TPA: acetylglutamate kinase [Hyphomonadaceae bacterium]|nr:acetylglutamate kinase [Hyphomonadaceae bacterium]
MTNNEIAAINALQASDAFSTARTLSEALPYIQRYDNKTIVIKYGGHAMENEELASMFAKDVVLLKLLGINPVVVHGGGPQIGRMLDKLGIVSTFEDGLRVTDAASMEIVEMVLAGGINKSIVRAINAAGGKAVGISGSDANLITAVKATRTKKDPDSNIERVVDLGFVGEPDKVDPSVLTALAAQRDEDFIPVVAPVGVGADGKSFNINADTAAGAVAAALGAKRVLFLTDVAGVLDKSGNLIKQLTVAEARALIADGTAKGGMIPKLETAMQAVEKGVEASVILDGRKPHALLMELFTEHGAGTLVR